MELSAVSVLELVTFPCASRLVVVVEVVEPPAAASGAPPAAEPVADVVVVVVPSALWVTWRETCPPTAPTPGATGRGIPPDAVPAMDHDPSSPTERVTLPPRYPEPSPT